MKRAPRRGAKVCGLYLLHFDEPYQHARHYLGYAKRDVRAYARDVANYLEAPHELVYAAQSAGIELEVVAVWEGWDRDDRDRLRAGGGLSRHCPTCRYDLGVYHR